MSESFQMEAEELAVHVAVCRERYRGIDIRLRRLEIAIYGLIVVLVANGDGPLSDLLLGAFR